VTDPRGVALIDLIAATALVVIMAAIAVPVVGGTLERERTIVGSQYLAGQLQRARLAALRRAAAVAVRIEIVAGRASLRLFLDGNGNGVLQKDIDKGVDPPLSPLHWIDEQARGVSLRINQSILDAAGSAALEPGDDPLRIGNTALVSFSPVGSATSGTLYVAAERGPQMAIRVFGATGRVRVLLFDAQTRQWHP
jgi:type II secretory pathway pseudopilin PulG